MTAVANAVTDHTTTWLGHPPRLAPATRHTGHRVALSGSPSATTRHWRPSRSDEAYTLWPRNFQEAFCEVHRCAPQKFRQRVLRKCLYPGAVPLAWLIGRLWPRFFRQDFEVIEGIARVRNWAELDLELQGYTSNLLFQGGLFRRHLRLRLSSRRLRRLATLLFGPAPRMA